MAGLETPAWLAPHLAAGEEPRFVHEPDATAWLPAIVSIALAAYLAFVVGFSESDYSWWRWLPGAQRATASIPPILASVVAAVGFGADAVNKILKHRYTAYAVTDRRLLRVGLLSFMPADAWPLSGVRIVESERKRRAHRMRVEVRGPDGRRKARFRLRVDDGDALRAAIEAGAPRA